MKKKGKKVKNQIFKTTLHNVGKINECTFLFCGFVMRFYFAYNCDCMYFVWQVSSSEYFSVTFEVGNINDPDEFVVAAKGTSLA